EPPVAPVRRPVGADDFVPLAGQGGNQPPCSRFWVVGMAAKDNDLHPPIGSALFACGRGRRDRGCQGGRPQGQAERTSHERGLPCWSSGFSRSELNKFKTGWNRDSNQDLEPLPC